MLYRQNVKEVPGSYEYMTSKEKHSLTRKLVGYRNRRQWWCKKEGNKVLGKEKLDKTPIITTSFGSVTFCIEK